MPVDKMAVAETKRRFKHQKSDFKNHKRRLGSQKSRFVTGNGVFAMATHRLGIRRVTARRFLRFM